MSIAPGRRAAMNRDDVKIIEHATAYDGYFRIDRYRLRHRVYEGGWSREVMREVFERGHAASVLPYDPVRDAVVLIEQFRIGAYTADWKPWIEEIVAGVIEPGETAEAVAHRETVEETGCTTTDLVKICDLVGLRAGRFDNSAIIIALQWLALNRDDLRQRWGVVSQGR
jgi:ADP-ribose pyrophosphatase